ncbi:hypothetical protein Ancab_007997 [Ancistrocladus abbreviatus]
MSSYARAASFLHLLCFGLLLNIAVGTDPLSHVCSTSGNYTASSPYGTNLQRLKSYLYYQTPWWGFALGTVGSQQDEAYGLAQCRGDVSFFDCQTCIADARDAITKLCPYNKGGIIWYDYCMLKFLDQDFFGQIDTQNKFCLSNVNNVSDPVLFDQKTRELLSQVSQRAAYGSAKLFAAGEMAFDTTTNIYGLVQCTQDLSNEDCKKCLDQAISEMPGCCGGKQGGRIVGGSCKVGYEIYPYVMSP